MAPEKRFRWAKLNYWDYLKSYIFVFAALVSPSGYLACAIESTNITRRLILCCTHFLVCNVDAPAHEVPSNTYIYRSGDTRRNLVANERRTLTHSHAHTVRTGARGTEQKKVYFLISPSYTVHIQSSKVSSRFQPVADFHLLECSMLVHSANGMNV